MLNPAHVRKVLKSYPHKRIERGDLRPSAVLMPLFVKDGHDWVLFTRRTHNLNHHGGEISFPGGSFHKEDSDLLCTALRETQEEMGVCCADVTVLGRLDDFYSVHGYHVVPFVGQFPHPYPFKVNRREVAEVIEVPLSTLADPAVFHREDWRHKGRIHPVKFYTVGEHQIWGLTAAILYQFMERVLGIKN